MAACAGAVGVVSAATTADRGRPPHERAGETSCSTFALLSPGRHTALLSSGGFRREEETSVIYLTQARLMTESERAVEESARFGAPEYRRVCSQLLAEPVRYTLWHGRQENRMGVVADARRRERQTLALRAFALEQIHHAALVRYLREYRIVGEDRAQTLREFHGVADQRDATLAAHREYLLAASSQVSAAELLQLVDDSRGIECLGDYERAYGQFFSMFCERSRAQQNGQSYLLECLLPEVRGAAARLRARVLQADTPSVRVFAARSRPHEHARRLTIERARLARVVGRP